MARGAWALLLCSFVGSLVSALSSCASEMPGPPVCAAQVDCAAGQRCVLGRCRKAGELPASARARRRVFRPVDMAALCSGECPGPSETLETFRLGAGPGSHDVVLLRFALRLEDADRVETALLVLEPVPSCTRRPGQLYVELAHVLEPWSSTSVRWARLPKRSLPMHAATISVVPARPLRLDVTELVEQWANHRTRFFGLALSASGRGPGSACYSAGLASGHPPRLDVYLAPDKKSADAGDAAADATDGADAAAEAGADATTDAAGS